MASKNSTTELLLAGATLPPDYVITPGGPRHVSRVHHVERGHKLKLEAGSLRKIDPAGQIVAEYAAVKRPHDRPLHELSTRTRRQAAAPGLGSGWIVFGSWENNFGVPVSSFSTTWVVPMEPLAPDDQLLYIFSGLENSTMIYQPVLQWGQSPAGGGGSWEVASWYVDGDGGDAFHSDLVQVPSGATLIGIMTLVTHGAAGFDYDCEFQNIHGTALPIMGVEELKFCAQTLEVYGVNRAANYPTRRIRMGGIDLRIGGNPVRMRWTPNNDVTDTGQTVRVISNSTAGSGEVDLFCYTAKTITLISNDARRIELFYTSIDDGIYRKFLLAPPDNWSADEPITQRDYALQIAGGINRLGLVEIFYVGTNQSLYHDWQIEGVGWIGEHQLNGASAKQVCVGMNQDGRLEVFYVGTNDTIYHSWQQGGGGWSPEVALGGFATQLSAGSNADGRIELVYIGTNDELYHNWQTAPNGGWTTETAFGGAAKRISVCRNGSGCLEVIYIGTNDLLYRNRQVAPNNGWSGEEVVGDLAKKIAVATNADGTLGLVYTGLDDSIYYQQESSPGGAWNAAISIGDTALEITVALNASGVLDLFYIAQDGLIHRRQQTAHNSAAWRRAELL